MLSAAVNLTTSRAKVVLAEGSDIGARDLVECVKNMNYGRARVESGLEVEGIGV